MDELLDELRDLTAYRHIAVVCHSMGGVLVGAALRRSFGRRDGSAALAHRVSCLIMLGSPRAGTRILPFGIIPSKDKPYLVIHSSVAAANSEFMTNYVDPSVIGEVNRRYHIPHFIGVGDADAVVDAFSAGFGIFTSQKRVFRGTHSGLLRHSDLPNWIASSVEAGIRGVAQRRRLGGATSLPKLVTRFEGHSLHGEWQDEYEKALRAFALQTTVPVLDVTRRHEGEPVGLLVRVLRCEDVGSVAVNDDLLAIKAAQESDEIQSVGVSPFGTASTERAKEIFDLLGKSESRWIRGTEDLPALGHEMVRWLHRAKFLITSGSALATMGETSFAALKESDATNQEHWRIDDFD